MKKRNYWPLFFIGIFSFTLIMIVWTIKSAIKAPVIEDRSFMQKYQYVDEHYNTIMQANEEFLKNYNLSFILNQKEFNLTTEDIKYGQREIEKHSLHKDLLKVGKKNRIELLIKDKNGNLQEIQNISLIITKTMTNDKDIILNSENFLNKNDIYTTDFELNEETNWIITGSFELKNNKGYIFIKTNAK